MTRGSLRLRLLVAAAVSILAALTFAGFVLERFFAAEVQNRIERELANHFSQLAGAIARGKDGNFSLVRDLADPRFQQPFGGMYWQIELKDQAPMHSRSLWDAPLALPKDAPGAEPRVTAIDGPDDEPVILYERMLVTDKDGAPYSIRIAVATNQTEVTVPVASFRRLSLLLLGCLALALALAAWAQAEVGLKPLRDLKRELEDIVAGSAKRLGGAHPKEIAPLVDEFNGVMDMQDRSLERARAQAGDLAHGLKTPLTVLGALARDLDRKGETEAARDIGEQVAAMQSVVERELARSRLASGHGPKRTALLPEVERIVAALKRLPKGSDLNWSVEVEPELVLPMDSADLTELLGNVTDNARKWATSTITISARYAEPGSVLRIEDDGPGVDNAELAKIADRGFSRDVTGSGLGLAIVRDIASAYGLSVSYGRSRLGGLAVSINFPGARRGAAKKLSLRPVQA